MWLAYVTHTHKRGEMITFVKKSLSISNLVSIFFSNI